MKKNCIIVHGCPTRPTDDPELRTYDKHWMPWTKEQLEARGIPTDVPLMPTPWDPVYDKYKKVFDQLEVNEDTILVGTSGGCTFLVRWLGETKKKVAKLILVAPWSFKAEGGSYKKEFYTFPIDESIKERVGQIIYFTADNESEPGKIGLKMFHDALGGQIIELPGYGHYIQSHMGTVEFPELIDVIIG